MNSLQILVDSGLQEREAAVYTALLELGESTVLPISKRSGIMRTYCYDVLDDLIAKGLVSYFEKNNRRHYVAEDPKHLETTLKERLERLSQAIPELRSAYSNGSKPKVRFYEGKLGLAAIYEEIVEHDEYCAIMSAGPMYDTLGDIFTKLAKTVVRRKIKARELATADQVPTFASIYSAPLQEIRSLPKSITFASDILMFGNKLVLVSYAQDIHAVVIEGSVIVESHKQLFELLWQTCK